MQSLVILLEGLQQSKKILSEHELIYTGFIDPSDIEFYYGIKSLAIQNYLKLVFNDLKKYCPAMKDKDHFKDHSLNNNGKITGHTYNCFQLINSCADYFKHKDDKITGHTKKVLEEFDLLKQNEEEDFYPLTEAYIKYINPSCRVEDLKIKLNEWEDDLYLKYLNEDYKTID